MAFEPFTPKYDSPPSVDLIAAGYEWICPDASCNALNTTPEVTETVTCRLCKTTYDTNPPEHAFR